MLRGILLSSCLILDWFPIGCRSVSCTFYVFYAAVGSSWLEVIRAVKRKQSLRAITVAVPFKARDSGSQTRRTVLGLFAHPELGLIRSQCFLRVPLACRPGPTMRTAEATTAVLRGYP